MADGRIKDLTSEVLASQIQALLNTLYLALDDDSFSDAKKILLKNLLKDTAVTDALNNYQALTPKGFYSSVATEESKGIVEKATGAEIIAETADKFMDAADQAKMREHWGKSQTGDNVIGRPKFWFANGAGENVGEHVGVKIPVMFATNRAESTAYNYYWLPDGLKLTGQKTVLAVINGVFLTTEYKGKVDNVLLDMSLEGKEYRFGGSNKFKFVFPVNDSAPFLLSTLAGTQIFIGDVYCIFGTA